MEVLNFINTHDEFEWINILTDAPYNITVRRDGDYMMLKYSHLNSDQSIPMVRECRGVIFYKNNGIYECVCRAFDKFGNYEAYYAADIDWNSAVVQEKIDGSLIKLYHHGDSWRIATNGTIDAFKANVGDFDLSFGDLVYQALGGEEQFKSFCQRLKKDNTYMFELVSPMSRATIYYADTKLYYLGQRNITTMEESNEYTDFMAQFGVLKPKIYSLSSLEECLEYVKTMTRDEEGFVVVDGNFNRIKIKSPEYLLMFHMENNGEVTTRRIINMMKEEKIDDFLDYLPQYTDVVNGVKESIDDIALHMILETSVAFPFIKSSKEEYAKQIAKCKYKDYLFKWYDNFMDLSPYEYIMSRTTNQILKMIKNRC